MTKTRYRILFYLFSIFLALSLFAVSVIYVLASPTHNIGSQINVNYVAPVSVNLNFVNNTGSGIEEGSYSIKYNQDMTQFYIDGIIPSQATYQDGSIINDKGQEFYYFSADENWNITTNAEKYYVSTEEEPIWYDFPEEGLSLYSIFLTPNVYEEDFLNAPLTTIENAVISHNVSVLPYNAFCISFEEGNNVLKSAVIPNSVSRIESKIDVISGDIGGAFMGCVNLDTIVIPRSVEYVGGEAFMQCSSSIITSTKDGISYLGMEGNPYAILITVDKTLTSLTIDESCISIQGVSFINMEDGTSSQITSIIIPSKVKTIGYYAMAMCMNLEELVFAEGSELEEIGALAFGMNTLIEEVILPEGLKNLGYAAFMYCQNLKYLTIPNGIEYIDSGAVVGCPSLVYNEYENGLYLGSEENKYLMLVGTKTKDFTSFTINSNSRFLAMDSMSDCTNLQSISIPESVEVVGDSSFSGCTSLISVTFVGNSQIVSIGDYLFRDCTSLASITIPSSITSIGNYAFSGCSSLTSITIPSSVTNIGNSAFSGCSSLTTINIPEGITAINSSTFYGCSNLTSITIPEGVTSIGGSAFSGCSSLTTINIPEGITAINSSTFSGCSGLTSITIPSTVTSIEGFAFSGCSSLTSITIPSTVTSIGGSAFYNCSNIQELRINDLESYFNISYGNNAHPLYVTVQEVDLYIGEELVTDLVIPSTVTTIPSYAFRRVNVASVEFPSSVTSIGGYAFQYSGLTNVTFEANSGLTSIGERVFSDCESLTSITIPGSVTSIGSYAFYNCSGLTSITIPKSVVSIGNYALYNCSNIQELHINDLESYFNISYGNYTHPLYVTVQEVDLYIGEELVTDLVIPSTVTTIPSYAFRRVNVASVEFPSSVTSIGGYAFQYSGLTNVTFEANSGLTSIGEYVFSDCESLTSITIPGSVTSIGKSAFSGCSSLTGINLPEGITVINSSTFSDCSCLTSITIPSTVTSIGDNAFYNCSNIQELRINDLESYFNISYGNYAARPLYVAVQEVDLYIGGELVTDLVIPSTVTTIPSYAFRFTNLLSVEISSNITSIGNDAFANCHSLTSVTFGNNSQLTTIDGHTFVNCFSLTSITIPSMVTSIGSSAFNRCYKLAEVINLSSLEITAGETSNGYVGYYAIEIKTAENSTGFYNIGDYLMYQDLEGNHYLMSYNGSGGDITLPTLETAQNYTIYQYAFYENLVITGVVISANVVSIGDYAFSDCNNLRYVKFEDNAQLTDIGERAFSGCKNLTCVTIPENVISIGSAAFIDSEKLVEVYNLSSLNITAGVYGDNGYVGAHADYVYDSLDEPSKQKIVGDYIFYYNDNTMYLLGYVGNDTKLILPSIEDIKEVFIEFTESIYQIYNCAFYNNVDIISVIMPECIFSIGDDAFYLCSKLTNITIPNSVTRIGNFAFCGCTRLISIVIPSSVTWSGNYVFSDCNMLTIFCEIESQPSEWGSIWNYSNCPVYWGLNVTWKYVDGVPTPIESGVESQSYSDIEGVQEEGFGIVIKEKRKEEV